MMGDAGRRLGRGLFCLVLVTSAMAQEGPDARLGNVMWRTPDPAVWSTTVNDGWVIFRAAAPEGQFAVLRIAPGYEALGEFRGLFDRWVEQDLKGSTVTTQGEPVTKTAQTGWPMLQQRVTTTERDGSEVTRLYLGMQPGDRFEMTAYAASSEALFLEWAGPAVALINTMKFVNLVGELVPEGALPVAAAAAAPVGDDQAEFKQRDITEDGWLDGTETKGVEHYDTDGDKEITWTEFQAGRAKERGTAPAAGAPAAPPATPAAPTAPAAPAAQPAAPAAPSGPAPKAPGPRALPAGQKGLDGLFFWLQTWMSGGNLSIDYHHIVLRPNGQAFRGAPPGGLENFDFDRLAQLDPKRTGYYSILGDKLHFEPLEGETEVLEFARDEAPNLQLNGNFALKVGKFPANYRFEGHYEAARSAGGAGSYVASIRSYQFRADGTFTHGRYGAVSTDAGGADSSAKNEGTYQLSGNTITINHAGGEVEVVTAYPYPDKDEMPPLRLSIDGAMFKRVE